MIDNDETYRLFNQAYRTKRFTFAGNLIFDVAAALSTPYVLTYESWHYKFQQLLQFLHDNQFVFESSDVFYDMLANIVLQIRKDPNASWRSLLN